MRIYHIHSIEQEFAYFFYGRESKFLSLFQHYRMASDWMKPHIERQITAVTKPLFFFTIERLLQQHGSFTIQPQTQLPTYELRGKDKEVEAIVEFHPRQLILKVMRGRYKELVLFELLRKLDDHLLVVDWEYEQVGWVKPIKEKTTFYHEKI